MKIGDKVVCVDDSPCAHCARLGRPNKLKAGLVYVIESFRVSKSGDLGFLLIGNHGNHTHGHYASRRFRLLDDLKAEAAKKQSSHPARPLHNATTTAPDLGTDWRASISTERETQISEQKNPQDCAGSYRRDTSAMPGNVQA